MLLQERPELVIAGESGEVRDVQSESEWGDFVP